MTSIDLAKHGYTAVGVGIALSTVGFAAPGLAQTTATEKLVVNDSELSVIQDMPIRINTRDLQTPGVTLPRESRNKRYQMNRMLPSRAFIPNVSPPSTTPITDEYSRNLQEWSTRVRTCMRERPQLYQMAVVTDTEDPVAGRKALDVAIPVEVDGNRGTIVAASDGRPVCPR